MPIQAAAISWPCRSALRVSMTLANCSGPQVLQVAHEQALDPVLGIAGPAAPPVLLPHRPAAHVPGHLDRELHDMEQVNDQLARGSARRTAEA